MTKGPLRLGDLQDLKRIASAILATDFYSFVQESFPIVSGGARLMPNWHLEAIAYELSQVMKGSTKRLIITVPPRSLKSICASVCFPAFVLGHDPTARLICVSYAESLARKHANDCRALMRSALFQGIFRTRISPAKDTETEVMTTARGSRLATSVGGTLTGRGGQFIIIDDPLKPQDAHSEAARESLKQWYANTLLSRLDHKDDGSIIVVMQRLHPDDLVGHLLEQGGWRHLNLPAIAEEETIIELDATRRHHRRIGDLLHSARESQAALDELKASMGSMEFAAQYQQAPVPIGGNLIKWSWFKFYDQRPVIQPGDRIIVSWDTAMSSGQLADYSACVVLLVRKETVYVVDVVRARLEYPDLKRVVLQMHERWRNAGTWSYDLLIEKKGSGLSLIQDLRRHNIHPVAVEPEGDKVLRMVAQTSPIEAGAVHLPANATWMEEFKKEILSFPKSRHDDQIDALSQALKRAYAPPPPQAAFGTYSIALYSSNYGRRPR
jgi:predicted phage terminase large subunit-like protein